jgi:hypothetical protein
MDLSQFKDVLGKPNEGLHATRIPIIDLAFWDVVGTFAIAYAFYLFGYGSIMFNFLILFVIAEVLHYIFGVKTAFIKYIT